ncbi:hypothetical protein EVJ58_g5100 [Rhodofomes roseus]|uniref:Uncharacterized protein n=1 Tax=Rhodofomes roseus TaxID=34475 RepID=A0A4Y9YF90_9APHY|nr:hypothetical protein EVJ58_g5100 [Rhodofomes roseus]
MDTQAPVATFWPHTKLLLGPLWTIVVSGPHIQVIDPISGKIVHSTARLVGAARDALLKSGPIRCLAVDGSFSHLATVGDDKQLKTWQIVGLRLMSVRPLPKKPTEIAFTRNGLTLLISDKFGDVFSYPLYPKAKPAGNTVPSAGSSKRGALTSHENPSDGVLVLGHVSLLTSFLLTRDEKYIVTADRDEHIRVSWYPKGYVVERYCLGHEKFVSEIHIPHFAPEVLISGGGDPVLKMWDWMSGEVVADVPIADVVEPYIKVKAPKGRRGWDDGDNEEGGAGENQPARRRRRGRKAQGKGKDVEEGSTEGTPVVEDGEAEGSAASGEAAQEAPEDDAEMAVPEEDVDKTVLVIYKIRSCDQGRHGKFVLFSAVGATALFYFSYPESGEGPPPKIHAIDFGHPVLDFMMGVYQTTWVLLDVPPAQAGVATSRANKSSPAVLLSWASGSQPVVVAEDDVPTLTTLRTSARLRATPDELKTLDLYSALSSMPKNVDPEHDPLRRDLLAEATPEPGAEDKGQKKELSQREQARLKKKRALAAKLAEDKKGEGDEGEGEGEGEGDERERKRVRSDSEAVGSDVGVASSGEIMDEA